MQPRCWWLFVSLSLQPSMLNDGWATVLLECQYCWWWRRWSCHSRLLMHELCLMALPATMTATMTYTKSTNGLCYTDNRNCGYLYRFLCMWIYILALLVVFYCHPFHASASQTFAFVVVFLISFFLRMVVPQASHTTDNSLIIRWFFILKWPATFNGSMVAISTNIDKWILIDFVQIYVYALVVMINFFSFNNSANIWNQLKLHKFFFEIIIINQANAEVCSQPHSEIGAETIFSSASIIICRYPHSPRTNIQLK